VRGTGVEITEGMASSFRKGEFLGREKVLGLEGTNPDEWIRVLKKKKASERLIILCQKEGTRIMYWRVQLPRDHVALGHNAIWGVR